MGTWMMLEKSRIASENIRLYNRIEKVKSSLSKKVIMSGSEKYAIVKPVNPSKIVRKV